VDIQHDQSPACVDQCVEHVEQYQQLRSAKVIIYIMCSRWIGNTLHDALVHI
jgi:hypothetical protein